MGHKSINKNKIRTRKNRQVGGLNNNMNNNAVTLRDNLKKLSDIFVQVFNNMGAYTLDKVKNTVSNISMSAGIDPNKSLKDEIVNAGKKAEELNKVLNTPEGRRALANLNAFFNRISRDVIIPNSERFLNDLIKNLKPVLSRGQKAAMALLSATPLGPLLDIPVFASESLGVVEKSVALADDVLDVTQDTVDQLKTEKSNLDEVVSEFGSLIDQANGELSSGLDSIKSSVYEQGQNLNNLKKYQMESKMIGGRINKSKNEFLYLQKQQSKKTRRNKYRP